MKNIMEYNKLCSNKLWLAMLCLLAVAPLAHAKDAKLDSNLDSNNAKFSYALGFSIGQDLKGRMAADALEVQTDQFVQAIQNVLTDSEPALSIADMEQALMEHEEKRVAAHLAKATEALTTGQKFMTENAKRTGVHTTEEGLQYSIITEGTGKKPSADDTVVVHYRGSLLDGTEFDSSYKRNQPATFPLAGVIPGWGMILQLMPTGSKWKVYIPPHLAYGEHGAGNKIGPNETLEFEIELLKIK